MEFEKWLTFVLLLGGTTTAQQVIDDGTYQISNFHDGSFLESRFAIREVGVGKNHVFTNDKNSGAEEQLWEVELNDCPKCARDEPFFGYVLENARNGNNEVSDSKPENSAYRQGHWYELLPVPQDPESGNQIFNIRSKMYKKCLVNNGTGKRIGWKNCDSTSSNQQWKFISA